MKTYKGTDRDMKCRDYQYEIGKEEVMDGNVELCSRGYHSCVDPLDVLGYYPPADSRYFEAEVDNVSDERSGDDSKVVSSKVKLLAEIGLKGIIEAGIKFKLDRVKFTDDTQATGNQAGAQATGYRAGAQATGYQAGAQATGDRAGAQATGYRAGAQATGYQAGAQATGYQAGAQATGYQAGAQATGIMAMASANGYGGNASVDGGHAVACALGYKCTAEGTKGSYLVLAERGDWDGKCYPIIGLKVVQVDGNEIKENVSYKLSNNEIMEDR